MKNTVKTLMAVGKFLNDMATNETHEVGTHHDDNSWWWECSCGEEDRRGAECHRVEASATWHAYTGLPADWGLRYPSTDQSPRSDGMSTAFDTDDDRDGDGVYPEQTPDDRARDARLGAIYTDRQLVEEVLRLSPELEFGTVLTVLENLRFLGWAL